MNEIEKKFLEIYGEFNLTTKGPEYRIFRTGWNAGHQLENKRIVTNLKVLRSRQDQTTDYEEGRFDGLGTAIAFAESEVEL
jgi:hypothetical protein